MNNWNIEKVLIFKLSGLKNVSIVIYSYTFDILRVIRFDV